MGWKDTFAAMRAELSPEGAEPPAIFSELEDQIHQMEVAHADALSGADTRIQDAAAKLAEKDAEILRLKGVNYDLLMSSPAGNGGDGNGSTGTNDKDSDDTPKGIDSLFGTSNE